MSVLVHMDMVSKQNNVVQSSNGPSVLVHMDMVSKQNISTTM